MASSISCVASGSSHHPHSHHIGQQGGDRSRVIGELSRGRDMAAQLRQVLREIGSLQNPSALDLESSTSSAGHVPAIVAEILDTFTQSISILSSGASHHVDVGSGEYSDGVVIPPTPPENARKLEGSGDSCKTTRKDKRGCHKRKKNTETWTKESSTWPEDRFAWRKYGQKVILHAKHPRNYFRCTHKYDEGCPATKQVQKIQDDPPVFRATYYAHHSCTSGTRTSSLGLPYPDPDPAAAHHHSSTIWSFHQPTATCHDPAPAPPVKKGSASSSCPTQTQVQVQSSSSSPNTPNPHHPAAAALSDFGSNPRRRALLSHQIQLPHLSAAYSSGGSAGSDHHGDVYSCTASSTRTRIQMEMEMDMTNSMISLDDLLPI